MVAVHGLPKCRPFLFDGETAHGKRILEEGIRRNLDSLVVILKRRWVHDIGALGRVSNLLDDIVHLLYCLLGGILVHPFGCIELFGELGLDVCDDGVAERLGLGGKGLLNEETAEDPSQAVVNVANT